MAIRITGDTIDEVALGEGTIVPELMIAVGTSRPCAYQRLRDLAERRQGTGQHSRPGTECGPTTLQ